MHPQDQVPIRGSKVLQQNKTTTNMKKINLYLIFCCLFSSSVFPVSSEILEENGSEQIQQCGDDITQKSKSKLRYAKLKENISELKARCVPCFSILIRHTYHFL